MLTLNDNPVGNAGEIAYLYGVDPPTGLFVVANPLIPELTPCVSILLPDTALVTDNGV